MMFIATQYTAHVHSVLVSNKAHDDMTDLAVPPTKTTIAMVHMQSGHVLHSKSTCRTPSRSARCSSSRYYGMVPCALLGHNY
jgi:hypothetical protein